MITKPTTLILGAGASVPFGFPTGDELKQKVLSLDDEDPLFEFVSSPKVYLANFKEALLKSGKGSVDAFLEHWTEFIAIGKTAIAVALIDCESEDILFSNGKSNWYQYLFGQLNTRFDEFDKNKLNILTFNYDRSLEHYLLTTLHNTYGKSLEQCAEKLKAVPIIHLHGDLGELPYLGDTYVRPYSSDQKHQAIRIAAQRIKIIHEGIEEQSQFVQAKKILSESNTICFLGFGYHSLNMERLGFNVTYSGPPNYHGKYIQGSTFGLTQVESDKVGRFGFNLRPRRGDEYSLDYRNSEVLPYLRETGVLLGN